MGIDLHAHTTASDGSYTPRQLVQRAHEIGLKAVAITDHDTLGGWEEAFTAGREFGVEVVPGIELSVQADDGEKFHLLGYYVSPDSVLARELAELQAERDHRNERILANLAALGAPITMERVKEIGKGVVGRPHIALALMEKGYASSVQDAFDRFLADGASAAASKRVMTPHRAVELIHQAGGVAIWAHPTRSPSKRAASGVDLEATEKALHKWLKWNLDGLETYYSQYESEEAAWAAKMSTEHGLLGTGGSDFHGQTKPTIPLGIVQTGAAVPDEVLEKLKEKARTPR